MSPALGRMHLLVAKNLQILRSAYKVATKYARGKLPATAIAEPTAQPAYARVARQPIHPAAYLKQNRRWFSVQARLPSFARAFGTTAEVTPGPSYASSSVGRAISQSSGRAPFATTLRPNLTGGAFPRSAGGYGLGAGRVGAKRYFSHTPEAPAQVINNVSQAMRAFMLGGQKIQYDGMDRRIGEKRFKSVSALQEKAQQKMNGIPRATPGSFIDFNVNPTITALAPSTMSAIAGYQPAQSTSLETLHTEGLLDILTVDFSRALKELTLVMADLQSLSSLGDMPISYEQNRLRVHFPGVDPETVESIAAELEIKRGVVGQDPDFDTFVGTEIALLFPFAPSQGSSEPSLYDFADQPAIQVEEDGFSSPTTLSDTGLGYDDLDYVSAGSEEFETVASRSYAFDSSSASRSPGRSDQQPLEYQDFEGIYRFIEFCDNAAR
ncbi:hypothetical protein BT63DRAFT_441361 [Microthyrium microscopicum]|uniref:Casein kinase II beta 2 subunit n=1 Tax=Microthyrium microscopicum TaxID=703497 RepID=A0A6A6UA67_9PEZI|nr:hypothetical protein BT63DRAFT_441361 [Microthyrium microscopicum]